MKYLITCELEHCVLKSLRCTFKWNKEKLARFFGVPKESIKDYKIEEICASLE